MGKCENFCGTECCGTCRFHKPFEQDRFICNCMQSQYYMDETLYDDYCEDWED